WLSGTPSRWRPRPRLHSRVMSARIVKLTRQTDSFYPFTGGIKYLSSCRCRFLILALRLHADLDGSLKGHATVSRSGGRLRDWPQSTREVKRMSEQTTPTRDLLIGCVQTLSEVSARLQSIIDRFEPGKEELGRLTAAWAGMHTPPVREVLPADSIEDDVVAEHRRRRAA